MKIKKFKISDVLFTSKINVYVMLYGDVVMKTYEHSVFPNKILALYSQGSIIGSKYDNESIKFDRW